MRRVFLHLTRTGNECLMFCSRSPVFVLHSRCFRPSPPPLSPAGRGSQGIRFFWLVLRSGPAASRLIRLRPPAHPPDADYMRGTASRDAPPRGRDDLDFAQRFGLRHENLLLADQLQQREEDADHFAAALAADDRAGGASAFLRASAGPRCRPRAGRSACRRR